MHKRFSCWTGRNLRATTSIHLKNKCFGFLGLNFDKFLGVFQNKVDQCIGSIKNLANKHTLAISQIIVMVFKLWLKFDCKEIRYIFIKCKKNYGKTLLPRLNPKIIFLLSDFILAILPFSLLTTYYKLTRNLLASLTSITF